MKQYILIILVFICHSCNMINNNRIGVVYNDDCVVIIDKDNQVQIDNKNKGIICFIQDSISFYEQNDSIIIQMWAKIPMNKFEQMNYSGSKNNDICLIKVVTKSEKNPSFLLFDKKIILKNDELSDTFRLNDFYECQVLKNKNYTELLLNDFDYNRYFSKKYEYKQMKIGLTDTIFILLSDLYYTSVLTKEISFRKENVKRRTKINGDQWYYYSE